MPAIQHPRRAPGPGSAKGPSLRRACGVPTLPAAPGVLADGGDVELTHYCISADYAKPSCIYYVVFRRRGFCALQHAARALNSRFLDRTRKHSPSERGNFARSDNLHALDPHSCTWYYVMRNAALSRKSAAQARPKRFRWSWKYRWWLARCRDRCNPRRSARIGPPAHPQRLSPRSPPRVEPRAPPLRSLHVPGSAGQALCRTVCMGCIAV